MRVLVLQCFLSQQLVQDGVTVHAVYHAGFLQALIDGRGAIDTVHPAAHEHFGCLGITFNRSPMTMSLLISISFFFLPNIIKSPNEKSSFKLQGYYTHFTPLFQ